MTMIPYGRQDISESDIQAVINVLRSNFLTQGPAVPTFENAVCKYVNARHAIAVNSATAALHIACLALGVGVGDNVWTSPNTFVASANCAVYCGANVNFVDIDPETYNMSVSALENKLRAAKQNKTLPKVLIPVAFAGQSCDMRRIHQLALEYGFYIIEDASHAIGGSYLSEKIGCSKYADITVFSFHPVKIITTAEGGMALTNNTDLFNRMQLLRSHGITRDSTKMLHEPDGDWYYQQIELGMNYRMTELQAALGTSQLTRIESFIERRRQLAERYNQAFYNIPVIIPTQFSESQSSFHLYPIQVKDPALRKPLYTELREKNINVNVHYIPVHTQPYYQQRGHQVGDYPYAEAYYARTISLPLYPALSNEAQEHVIQCVRDFFV